MELKKWTYEEYPEFADDRFDAIVTDGNETGALYLNDVEYVIMERDKNLRNYITLKNLEDAYYKAKNNIKEYKPMNEGLALFLFLLLIIPGIIYVSKKRKEKKFIDANNQKMKKEMARVIQEGEQYRR